MLKVMVDIRIWMLNLESCLEVIELVLVSPVFRMTGFHSNVRVINSLAAKHLYQHPLAAMFSVSPCVI